MPRDQENARRLSREWYWRNKETIAEAQRQYYEDNKEHLKQVATDNRQKRKQIIYEAHGEFCCFCGSTERLEFDHRDTSLKESKDFKVSEVDNLRVLCYSCHKKWSSAQNRAAWHLLNSLPFEEREHLINQFYET